MRLPVAPRPSAEDRAAAAMAALQERGFARIPGDGAAFSRVYRLLEERFARERDAYHAGAAERVHRYTLRRDLYADEWTITREELPPAAPEVCDAYRARVAARVCELVAELRAYGAAGFADTSERSPIDGHWFDRETLELLEHEARAQGLRYRIDPCKGFRFAWITRVS